VSISGKFMTCAINGVEIVGNYEWEVDEAGAVLDRTVGADGGKARQDTGVDDTTVSIRGYMDIADGQYTPVRRGTEITNLNLYRNSDDVTPAFEISEAIVSRSNQKAAVRGKVEWSATVLTQGAFDYNDPA
jgi:hypothetical protein